MIAVLAGLAITGLATFAAMAAVGAAQNPNAWERAYCAGLAVVFAGLAGFVALLVL